MEDKIQQMIDILTTAKPDAAKADKGNAQAGKRLRASIASLLPMIKAVKAQSLGK
jgi:hypothetical protein